MSRQLIPTLWTWSLLRIIIFLVYICPCETRLKDDTSTIRELPDEYAWSAQENYASPLRSAQVKNPHLHASAGWYLKNVAPDLKSYGIVAVSPKVRSDDFVSMVAFQISFVSPSLNFTAEKCFLVILSFSFLLIPTKANGDLFIVGVGGSGGDGWVDGGVSYPNHSGEIAYHSYFDRFS
ncbi:hypothetical protein Tco_1306432 [Tanacetum coccineum]